MDLANEQPLFTCLSCSIAFLSAEEQRTHYRSDHHRYNMKRRVASLPPVSVAIFNQKVLERRQETAIMSSLKGSTCEVCGSHINSKKHKENELKTPGEVPSAPVYPPPSSTLPVISETHISKDSTSGVPATATEDDINESIDAKIAAARSRLSPAHCLFCPHTSSTLSDNLTHMSSSHSFFVPDADYLVDLPGLITYLGEKIAVGNVCIYCNGKGRELRTLEAVRKHMLDKAHCKIAYDSEDDRLEVSDYYDFTTSYPVDTRKKKSKQIPAEDEEWEDAEDDSGDAEEVVDEAASEPPDSESDSNESIPENQITYGDTEYELVLPSGARIGHRSMKRYYAQSLQPTHVQSNEDRNSGIALVRRLLADKNSALVPRKGGFGAHGQGMETVKARNRGEAREAGRHVREFRDQKRREDFKTRHFRDPLLQSDRKVDLG
ncbi:cytoplasmic protein [Suillus fuscotomentosus]|uniref:Cytoplasmic protein n=1 Tax=Suillus fuscotomentosus TaxID=1912939 RepID=A0AAD4DZD8_9AGAM|nr:cytoplasmic protein [Suillus fuscotomentosus]KAG1896705.1 cytoplasmic protein [Suillus fuscotomentosus]